MNTGAANTRPSFSVLVANYNHAALVGRAVDSVLAQDYPVPLREVIVVDDGSTDDSRVQLARFDGVAGVRVVLQENRGQTGAFANALAHASGDLVCLLDADDRFLPNKLQRIAAWLEKTAGSPDDVFLCHDLAIHDGADGPAIATSWFQVTGLHRFGPSLHMAAAHHFFPFSVTSGQVYGRKLLARVVEQLPLWDWPMGADAIIGHTAMVLTGEVQYLPEVLGSYIVHGGNNFASVEGGVFVQKPVWHDRWPKKLRFLEALIDSLDLGDRDRGDRLAYLGRVEHAVRAVPSSRRMTSPLFSFVVDAGADAALASATLAALEKQTHGQWEVVWVGTPAVSRLALQSQRQVRTEVPPGANHYTRLRVGLQAARGSYLCFLQAGDIPDRRYAERHLHTHRYGALPMVTVCDLRLIDAQDVLVHVGVQATAGGWNPSQLHIPPFSGSLRDWFLAPLPAVVFRRTPFLDAFFQESEIGGHDRLAGWLLCQFMVQLGGATRMLENLVDYRLPDGATANPSWLSQPADHEGPLPAPDFVWAAEALFAAYCRTRSGERAYFSDAWEARFLRWLMHAGGPQMASRIETQARRAGDAAWLARIRAMLQAAAARP